MTDYVLETSSFAGFVWGAKHFTGTVKGPHPKACHGRTIHFNAPELRGKRSCDEGHELPEQISWGVDAYWTEGHYDRYRASGYEADGPGQFVNELDLVTTAVQRFLGDVPSHVADYDRWWEEPGVPGEQGDRLFYLDLPYGDEPVIPWTDDREMPEPGMLLAVINFG